MNWLYRRTVDSIVASLSTLVHELEAHRAAMVAEAEKQAKIGLKHELLAGEAEREAARAEDIAKKIGDLLK